MELREIPITTANITDGEQPAYLVKFHQEGLWKGVSAWKDVFNPIDGVLKEATPYVGMFLGYYEASPSWVVMVAITFVGRDIMYGPSVTSFEVMIFGVLTVEYRSRITRQNLTPRVPPTAATGTS